MDYKTIAITATVIVVSSVPLLVYSWTRVPAKLKSLPSVSFWRTFFDVFDSTRGYEEKYIASRSVIPAEERRLYLLPIGPLKIVAVASPEAAKIVLDQNLFDKLVGIDSSFGLPTPGKYVFGDNLATVSAKDWPRHRTVCRPAFAKPLQILVFTKSVSKLIHTIHNLDDKSSVPIYSWMQRVTLHVLGSVIFSFDFGSLNNDDGGKYVTLWHKMMGRVLNPFLVLLPLWSYIPTKTNLETWELCNTFRQLMIDVIEQKRKDLKNNAVKSEKEKDLMDLMILAADDESVDWTAEDLMYNLSVFFVAGHDTTANVISAAIYFMAKHKHIQEKARAEVYSILGKPTSKDDGINTGPMEISQLNQMQYIHCIMKEAMRLYPSASTTGVRKAMKDVNITYRDMKNVERSFFVSKGTLAVVDIFGMHRDPVYFPNPLEFDPSRFQSENQPAWLTFGTGPRQCIGMQFSLIEQKVVLSMLLRNFEFDLVLNEDGSVPPYKTGSFGLLRPEGLKVKVKSIV
ncbi:Cytochrome P450 4V2 [Nowakowskiella sp. JEL0407]|nr:Cytochrome P450 4V2 [Nowakowskiella sp. JEL0407]